MTVGNWFCSCGAGDVGANHPPALCPLCGRRVWRSEGEDVYPASMVPELERGENEREQDSRPRRPA